jgi:hypothetical protein
MPAKKERVLTQWMKLLLSTHKQMKKKDPKTTFKMSMKHAAKMYKAFKKEFEGRSATEHGIDEFVKEHL